MKKLFTLLVLLATTIGAKAQLNGTWANKHTSGHKTTTVINAKLQIKDRYGSDKTDVYQGNYTIAAFVGEEGQEDCRLVTLDNAENVLFQPDASDASVKILTLAVPGNYTNNEDIDKPITFMIRSGGYIYKLNASTKITFREGNAYGLPASTSPVVLSAQESIVSIGGFNVGVGESINLREKLTVDPTGGSIPMNVFKIPDQYSEYATLNGDVLTGVKPINNAILYLVNHVTGNNIESIPFNVLKHAESISLLKTTLTVELNDASTLSDFMKDKGGTYKLTPADANDNVLWEIADESYISYSTTGDNPWKPIKAGTVKIRPYVKVGSNKIVPADNQWVTVTIKVAVTKAYLKWDSEVIDVKCNRGDDFYQRFLDRVKIEPAEADQTFTIELENASDSKYLKIDNDNKSLVALARNKGLNVWVIPNGYGGYEKKFLVKVSIEDEAQSISWTKSTLTLSSNLSSDEMLQAIIDNLTWSPDGSIPYGGIHFWETAGGDTKLDVTMTVDETGKKTIVNNKPASLVMETGNHVVYAEAHKNNYNVYYGKADQISDEKMLFASDVIITTGLDHFDIEWLPYDGKTYGKIRLTPVPSDAQYDISDFTKTFTIPQAYTDLGWTGLRDITWGGLDCYIEASLPGIYTFTVTKGGVNYGTKKIDIPAHISFNFGGWKWTTIPYGNLSANKIKSYFNSRVVEARTYDDLLTNDPSWGFFGSMLNSGISKKQMYKVQVGEYANDFYYYLEDAASLDTENAWTLQPGWNWVGSPYFYDRLFSNAIKTQSGLVAGLVVVSKADGQKEYDGTAWKGDLNLLKAEEGYLVYNPTNAVKTITLAAETTMTQGDETSTGARSVNRAGSVDVWQYDDSQFADNMTMVVEMADLEDAENYTIGAFVDGECRGEGVFEDGFGFVTVHCNSGELVTFQLHNELTGEYYDIDQTVKSKMRIGSLESPYKMTSTQNTSTGIGTVTSSAVGSQLYDLNGHQLNSQRKGVSIQRRTDGTVRKVVVK